MEIKKIDENELAAKYNLKNQDEYNKAILELNTFYNNQLKKPYKKGSLSINLASRKKSIDRSNNLNAVLTYNSSHSIEVRYYSMAEAVFLTHPQIKGIFNARLSVECDLFKVTLPLSEVDRFTNKETTFFENF